MGLIYTEREGKYINDSARLVGGKFSFAGSMEAPTVAYLIGQIKSTSVDDPNFAEFFLEPKKMDIILEKDNFKKGKLHGSFTQNEWDSSKKQRASIYTDIELINEAFHKNRDLLAKDKDNKTLLQKDDEIRKSLIPYRTKIRNLDYEFIAAHPNSYLSPYLLILDKGYLSVDSTKMFYARFTLKVQNSYSGKLIGNKIGGYPGSMAKDFTTTDINGKVLTLSSFKGKYVLLDFWATWCVPCRANSPHLIELYNKYHSKGLEIIGVAKDDDRIIAWKKAVAADKTGIFNQVLLGRGGKDDIEPKFPVNAIPVKILIDKKGMIVFRHENDDDDLLDKKLEEIFNQ